MKMSYNFTEMQKNTIIEKLGNTFYLSILKNITVYSQKWQLHNIEFSQLSSHNALFFCESELYGKCVLKLYGGVGEYHALREYDDSGKFCRFFKFDLETRVMLIERIMPGNLLKEEPSLEKRLAVFSSLFSELHVNPKNPEIYASYIKMVCDVTEVMKTHKDSKDLYAPALKMKEIYLEMSSVYDKETLLHWDLHNENILLCNDGLYKIIDPMGLIGDPVMEIGRYMSKEYTDTALEKRLDIVNKISDYFETNLNIPKKILKQCFFIDVVFLNCHFAEHGIIPRMDDVRFAQRFLDDDK